MVHRRGRREPPGRGVRVRYRVVLRGRQRGGKDERRVGGHSVCRRPASERQLVFSARCGVVGHGVVGHVSDNVDDRRRGGSGLPLRSHGGRGVLKEASAVRERRSVVDVGAGAVWRRGRRLVAVTRRQSRGVARRGRDERREAESRARIHRTVGQARSRAPGPSALHVSPRDRNVLGGDVKVSHLVVSVRVHAGLVFRERRRDARGKRRDNLR
mmetsp:Transcript_8359/g.33717  ORF Transcript_8359/g.33717 Transcript_8359/m.33717 type:complete len:213 (-) Transcript_8359:437-1075(-)